MKGKPADITNHFHSRSRRFFDNVENAISHDIFDPIDQWDNSRIGGITRILDKLGSFGSQGDWESAAIDAITEVRKQDVRDDGVDSDFEVLSAGNVLDSDVFS